jgi:glycosyltransferase 2 family protein
MPHEGSSVAPKAFLNRKAVSLAVALAGLALGTALVGLFGFHRVIAGALSVGWGGFALLVLWQGCLFVLLGVAWWALLPRRPAMWIFIWARMVRDAAANCLPLSAVGGFLLGARAATLHGLAWPMASASTVADVTAEFLTQLVFAMAGLGILIAERPDGKLALPFGVGIAIGVVGGAGFVAVQRGAAPLARRLRRRIRSAWIATLIARVELLQAELVQIYAGAGRFAASSAMHLLAWVANGIGGWLIMRLVGVAIGIPEALAIEGLLQAALTAAFAVPGFAGVQEAAYVVLGGVFGLAPDAAIAVSLVRRARDIAVGVPVLMVWQFIEARRLQPAPSV